MKLIYTVCTANYLYQALTMGESLKNTNPDYELIIGLVDEIPVTDFQIPYKIIPISDVQTVNLAGFKGEYTVMEVATACKPVFGLYLFEKYPNLEKLIYFDTDLWILDSVEPIQEKLNNYDIILTPHITQPIDLQEQWNEKQFLNAGLYNTGFVGMRRSENTFNFLNWWKNHLKDYGYYDFCNGMGIDQLCVNFVPLFYDKVLIDYNPAYNLAYWNLHERKVEFSNGKYLINGKENLLFFHFSGYSPEKPQLLSRHIKSSKTSNYPALITLFDIYHKALLKNHYQFFKSIIPAYGKYNPPKKEKGFIAQLIEKSAWKIINFIDNF
ncbi:MAG: hypothetical protein MUF58_02055 [Arcicella sp.]|jgi:hypothetical protein|nr:hypothetical protein [Arcicella sp.]